jgi:hypothetical protein
MSIDDILDAPEADLIAMKPAAKQAGEGFQSFLRNARRGLVPVVKRGRAYYTTRAAVRQYLIDKTAKALAGRKHAPAPIRTPAAKSRGHNAAVKKLVAAGVMPATAAKTCVK